MLNTNSKAFSTFLIAGIYILTFVSVYFIFPRLPFTHKMVTVLITDIFATIMVFLFSMAFKNSSVYDPFWSLAPPIIAIYLIRFFPQGNVIRQIVLLFLIFLWGIRLTGNWLRGWKGLKHQDWRYASISEKTGKWYWLVSFLGIHFMPTFFVFLGCLPLWYSLSSSAPFSFFDVMAALITLSAILTEWVADEQLRNFKSTHSGKGFMKSGLWAFSRHPNYLGEISFWGGIFLFAVSSSGFNTQTIWSSIGFISMVILFKFISVPLMEKRNIHGKPGYQEYMKQVPALFPKLFKG
jgi:steroid 5-alpha reductase family enzyme